ncbi:MAG: carbon monoxide dehydrogenase subunit G [Ktedonobacteraceae bacterium]|nr:carbon monoxide dehydrogenase subunit G [Ktedonobacteraceae bacterium]
MKLQGAVTVSAAREQVWQVLLDPAQLCRVIPGCEQARQLDDTHYEADLSVKVQFMTVRSHAKGTLLEVEAPRRLVGELVGEPLAMAGAFRARVTLELISQDAATTVVHYTMDLTLVGRLASLGEAIVRSTSQKLSRQFADNIASLFRSSDPL